MASKSLPFSNPSQQRSFDSRFWLYVDKAGPVHPVLKTPCWLWTGCKLRGYGILFNNKKGIYAHRYSFFIHYGYWPQPMCLHSCDNPPCLNPDHLRAGTSKDNMKDMWERQPPANHFVPMITGQNHPNSKLNDAAVLEIRRFWAERRYTYLELAKKYKVSMSNIWSIVTGKSWKHLLDENDLG